MHWSYCSLALSHGYNSIEWGAIVRWPIFSKFPIKDASYLAVRARYLVSFVISKPGLCPTTIILCMRPANERIMSKWATHEPVCSGQISVREWCNIEMPLFATRFAACTGGIRAFFMQPRIVYIDIKWSAWKMHYTNLFQSNLWTYFLCMCDLILGHTCTFIDELLQFQDITLLFWCL